MNNYNREKRLQIDVYALPHKKKKIQKFAKMMGYSTSALMNLAFDELYERKKEEFNQWLMTSPTA